MEDRDDHRAKVAEDSNSSDHTGDLIRRNRRRRETIATLQAAITEGIEGIESGKALPFDADAFLLSMRQRHSAQR